MQKLNRRSVLSAAFASIGWNAAAQTPSERQIAAKNSAPISPKDNLKVTKLETILVKPRWLFLKIHTNAGIVGLGEPITEGRALTCATAVKEIEPYLVGKDPRRVAHHWQAIYRHAFYRGGPILTSALSGIDQALWDIKGKALGVPVYELLGGPTRDRVRVYAHAGTPDAIKAAMAKGFTAFKTGPAKKRPARYIETQAAVEYAVERFAELRKIVGKENDVAIDFHGAISPATAKLLIKGLEPYQPMFVEEPCQAQNHDVMAEIARGTFLPIATGERVFTKWGFREVLEKKAAMVLQPDLCHAGGITEVRLIAGMAEAYYASVAPHNPLGPISLAAGVQIAASIPNFLCQEQVSLGEGYIKQPFKVSEGYLELPKGPGLGIELDENAMADKIHHDWRNQESYDTDDGSVVDW
ncbi:MAG: galactonate dehydratase [Acidobacteria bacterium]|nr:galactonate dehydratase [Acidobacteriota bacterium]